MHESRPGGGNRDGTDIQLDGSSENNTAQRFPFPNPPTVSLPSDNDPTVVKNPLRRCSIQDCDKPVDSRGWCKMHWWRWRHYGDPGEAAHRKPGKPSGPVKLCSAEGCDRPHHAHSYCGMHAHRWVRDGDIGDILPIVRPVALERFWEKIDRDGPIHPGLGTKCWVWTGGKTSNGRGEYGNFYPCQQTRAHRYSFKLASGMFWPWFCDLQIDHRCHNSLCVNPQHLRPATNKQNQENHAGLRSDNKSGVRGVYWSGRERRWIAQVGHNGRTIRVGRFASKTEAEAAVIAKRNELFTHNDIDREVGRR